MVLQRLAVAAFVASGSCGNAFLIARPHCVHVVTSLQSTPTGENELLKLSLTKPLGLILEEVEEGKASGVFVKEVSESGSAQAYASDVTGASLVTVDDQDVTSMDFDAVMETIINSSESIEIAFRLSDELPMGTPVKINVIVPDGKDLTLDAQVGDNLRQVLLDSDFAVYQGLKQTIGNCGGAGQCTFCAMDFIESSGWSERSDYENEKLSKFASARLACLNDVQGPATIQKTKR